MKYIEIIPLESVAKIAIVPGDGRTLSQAKGNADFAMNGGFYDMTSGQPVNHLKIGGRVLSRENWTAWGYAWENIHDLGMHQLPSHKGNYLGGVELLTPWSDGKLSYPKEVGGSRGRTAIALTGDKLVLYCSQDGTKDSATPEGLRDELVRLGAETALMLDGGGSSQCDFQGRKITSTRRVHNYILVWLKKEPEKEEKPMGKTVVLDPGHGVETAGKRSPDGSFLEYWYNLDMAERCKDILERHGVKVILTRGDDHDVNLLERVALSNRVKPDLFVSLHFNAYGDGKEWTSPDGFGIYTSSEGDKATRNIAARAILKEAEKAGVKLWGGGLHHDRLYVLRNTVAPAVLIEHGFYTNRSEVERLKNADYRQKLAEIDCNGILATLGIAYKAETPAEDTDAPDKWAAPAWDKATKKGILDGTRPKDSITRQEVAVMLDKLGLI